MNNSISLEDVSIMYTQILLLMSHLNHNSYKFSVLDRFRGETSPCVLWSEKLTVYLWRNLMQGSMTLVLMYIKPWQCDM